MQPLEIKDFPSYDISCKFETVAVLRNVIEDIMQCIPIFRLQLIKILNIRVCWVNPSKRKDNILSTLTVFDKVKN